MKIDCPDCGTRVVAAQMDLDAEAANCAACGASFSIAEQVSGRPSREGSNRSLERPYDARLIVESSPTELKIRVPARGMRLPMWGLLGMAVIYLAIVYYWTTSALDNERNPLAWNIIILSVGGLLSIFSLGPLGTALFVLKGELEYQIDSKQVLFETRCLFFHSVQQISREEVQLVRRVVEFVLDPPFQNRKWHRNAPISLPGVEIVLRDGSIVVPVETNSEGNWLTAFLKEFLGRTATVKSPTTAEPAQNLPDEGGRGGDE